MAKTKGAGRESLPPLPYPAAQILTVRARRRYYALTDAGRERLTQDCAVWQETRRLIDQLLEEKA